MAAEDKSILVKAIDIHKEFGPTIALNGVSIEVRAGEVRGLIGENGSGKSTLSSIIAGVQKADSGEMSLLGEKYAPANMNAAQESGVSIIVQEMGTIPNISVAENIFVAKESLFLVKGLVSAKKMKAEAKKALDNIGVNDIDPSLPINALNFEDRKLVEVARAMYTNPKLIIIDETTTALSQRGRTVIYRIIEKMQAEGKAVLFITHDLEELITVCNCVTVLRDGKLTGNLTKDEMDPDKLRSLMVGRELTGSYYRSDWDGGCRDETALEIRDLTAGNVLENFSCDLHRGEILGIGGLSDCGMHDLGKAAFGAETIISGSVTAVESGNRITSPEIAIRNRIGYVSKNRDQEALITSASILDNITLPSLKKLRNSLGIIWDSKEKALAERERAAMDIKCNSVGQLIKTLSGGNKQKVVFAKWLGAESEILILDCPTRGIDIGVKALMYQVMYQLKQEGKAILLISEELPELIGMSDRILILKDGIQAGEFRREDHPGEQNIIQCMI